MLTVRLYLSSTGQAERGGLDLLERWQSEPAATVWLDIQGAFDAELQRLLQERLCLHPLALQDASRDRHPPKVEVFEDHTFIVYKGLAAGVDSIDGGTIQIAAFVGERFLVTRHSGESPSIERLSRELETQPDAFRRGPGAMAARLSRFIADRYLRVLLDLEPRLEELEEAITGDSGESILGELVAHKADLTRLQRFLHYHVQVARELRSAVHPGFRPEDEHDLIDVLEHQERASSLCAMYYQLAHDLIEGYISVSSHRLNQIMRILTIITAVFVPLSFLAGIYGMNFENMPELQSRWGYFALLVVMGFVATTLLYTFKRKRWI
jgi:magnesium transporter